MQDTTRRSPIIRLGVTRGAPFTQFSTLLATQRAEEPETRLTLEEVALDNLMTGLVGDRYDAGFSLQEAVDPALDSQPLWHEEVAVAVPEGSPLLGHETLDVVDLVDYPIVLWPDAGHSWLECALSHSRDRRDIRRASSFEMFLLRIAAGHGVGICSRPRIESAHTCGIATRPLIGRPCSLTTYLLKSAHPQPSCALVRLERRAQRVAESSDRCASAAGALSRIDYHAPPSITDWYTEWPN